LLTILYIKQHNKTGLKYFGKSNKTLNEFSKYKGSGKHWFYHLKKHGNDVTTRIYAIFEGIDDSIIEKIAVNFSIENNIVNSKEWANLILENGLSGAPKNNKLSEETKLKISKANIGKKHSEETKLFFSQSRKGDKHWTYFLSENERKEVSKHLRLIDRSGIKNGRYGKPTSKETKLKISKANSGKKCSEETKKLLSEVLKNKKHNLKEVKCIYCDKIGKGPNMTRYHFEKCKYKKEINE
jgi:hypothetical protein